jgi:hypothetical protein
MHFRVKNALVFSLYIFFITTGYTNDYTSNFIEASNNFDLDFFEKN